MSKSAPCFVQCLCELSAALSFALILKQNHLQRCVYCFKMGSHNLPFQQKLPVFNLVKEFVKIGGINHYAEWQDEVH